MSEDQINDYDKIVAKLKLMAADRKISHTDRMQATADLHELLELGTFWMGIQSRNPERPGQWHNQAVLNWVGYDLRRRLPFVFEVLGLGRLND